MRPSVILVLAMAAVVSACAQPSGVIATSRPAAAATPQKTATLRPAPDPRALLGVSPQAVEQALGRPGFESRDGDARIWRYSGKACTLLVIFYDEAGAVRSTHLDARQTQGGAAPLEPCLRDVVNAPRA